MKTFFVCFNQLDHLGVYSGRGRQWAKLREFMRRHKKVAGSRSIRRTEQTNIWRIAKWRFSWTLFMYSLKDYLFDDLFFHIYMRFLANLGIDAKCQWPVSLSFRPVISEAGSVRCCCQVLLSHSSVTNNQIFQISTQLPKMWGRTCMPPSHNVSGFNIATQRATCPLRLDINFILRYYCLKARTHITAVITFSMTHFNALSTPVHWVQHRRCRVIVCLPGCSWGDLLDHIRCHHLDRSQWFGHLLCRCLSPAQIDGPMPSRGPIKWWIFFIKRH